MKGVKGLVERHKVGAHSGCQETNEDIHWQGKLFDICMPVTSSEHAYGMYVAAPGRCLIVAGDLRQSQQNNSRRRGSMDGCAQVQEENKTHIEIYGTRRK